MSASALEDSTKKRHVIVGSGMAVAALLANPVIGAVSPLSFVFGLIVAVAVPSVCGLVAVTSGVKLYRRSAKRAGAALLLASVLATAVGILYGLSAVF